MRVLLRMYIIGPHLNGPQFHGSPISLGPHLIFPQISIHAPPIPLLPCLIDLPPPHPPTHTWYPNRWWQMGCWTNWIGEKGTNGMVVHAYWLGGPRRWGTNEIGDGPLMGGLMKRRANERRVRGNEMWEPVSSNNVVRDQLVGDQWEGD